jgi:hypothetical protein
MRKQLMKDDSAAVALCPPELFDDPNQSDGDNNGNIDQKVSITIPDVLYA